VKDVRDAEFNIVKRQAKKGKAVESGAYDPSKPKILNLYVAKEFPAWQQKCLEIIKGVYNAENRSIDRSKLKDAVSQAGLAKDKRAMPFCVNFQANIDNLGADAAFERGLAFDEEDILQKMKPYLLRQLGFSEVKIFVAEQATGPEHDGRNLEAAEPGKPAYVFTNPE